MQQKWNQSDHLKQHVLSEIHHVGAILQSYDSSALQMDPKGLMPRSSELEKVRRSMVKDMNMI